MNYFSNYDENRQYRADPDSNRSYGYSAMVFKFLLIPDSLGAGAEGK